MGIYKVNGLTKEEVKRSRELHGSNFVPPPHVESFWEKLTENFEVYLPLLRLINNYYLND